MSDEQSAQNAKFDLKNFIHLLQLSNTTPLQKNSSLQLDKLSIILSASQPQSSLTDKQNLNASSNGSFANHDAQDCLLLIKEIEKVGLQPCQHSKLKKVYSYISQTKKQKTITELKLKTAEEQLFKQKKGTDEMLKALITMDEEEKQLWKKFDSMHKKYTESLKELEDKEKQNENLFLQLQSMKKDQQFLKKLILVANDSYEELEKKCRKLQQEKKHEEYFNDRKSSRDTFTRSTKTKKSSYSPSISDTANVSPRKNDFEQNYRRLVVRTLKSKFK